MTSQQYNETIKNTLHSLQNLLLFCNIDMLAELIRDPRKAQQTYTVVLPIFQRLAVAPYIHENTRAIIVPFVSALSRSRTDIDKATHLARLPFILPDVIRNLQESLDKL